MAKRNGEPRGTGFEPPEPPPPPDSPGAPLPPPSPPSPPPQPDRERTRPMPVRALAKGGQITLAWMSRDVWQTVGLLGGGGAFMLVGAMLVVIQTTWQWGSMIWIVGLVLLVLGLVITVAGISGIRAVAAACTDRTAESQALYHRFLVGLGFLLFAVSLLAVVGFAGMLYRDQVPSSGAGFKARLAEGRETPVTQARPAGPMLAVMLLVSAALSLVGATFFVTGSMREHQVSNAKDGSELFDECKFWGGLWFRLGQAVLYTLVFFIVVWAGLPGSGTSEGLPDSMIVLPVVGLLLGMFVKAGEALVAGLAERILGAVSALVGPPKK